MQGEYLNEVSATSGNKEDVKKLHFLRTTTVYKNMRDPALLKSYYRFKTLSLFDKNEVEGSSPPDLFVGRYGYPYVYIGPMVPPQFGDTSILSTPESWVGKSIQEIVEYRSMLVRGMYRTKITNIESGRIENAVKDLALSDKFIYADAKLSRKPDLRISMNENSQPYGPSAMLQELDLGVGSTNVHVENAHEDTDMSATTAILELYNKGVMVSKIQKALSAGLLGYGKNRKFVPTRWSITAVDDTVGRDKLKRIKEYDYLDSIKAYYTVALDNRWLILMVPGPWSYELVEAWYPGTSWNVEGDSVAIFSSHELYNGRTQYAEIGGCYYAARLASAELLEKQQKQARVIVLREAHPGYIMPMGVWNVREHVRESLRGVPMILHSMDDVLRLMASKFDIPLHIWIKNSSVLRYILHQKQLSNFMPAK